MHNSIYITSIKHISAQLPLVDDWFEHPLYYSESYIRAIDPDYKQFFTPNETRRLGKIFKRALLVSRVVLLESVIAQPDAIITGTGLGCIENTEIFLDKMVREGEELLNPTHFMQSTHNMIGSLIAIDAQCKNYNNTYSHKGISFECSLQDAFLQMQREKGTYNIASALVGAHDELTPAYFQLLKKAGYTGNPTQTFAGETAVAMMLRKGHSENALCEIEAVEKVYGDPEKVISSMIQHDEIDYIMTGINGNPFNDNIYFDNCARLFPPIPLLQYKNIFGESFTAPALGVYAAAICLQKGAIPAFLLVDPIHHPESQPVMADLIRHPVKKILCYNHSQGKNHSFILLSKQSLQST